MEEMHDPATVSGLLSLLGGVIVSLTFVIRWVLESRKEKKDLECGFVAHGQVTMASLDETARRTERALGGLIEAVAEAIRSREHSTMEMKMIVMPLVDGIKRAVEMGDVTLKRVEAMERLQRTHYRMDRARAKAAAEVAGEFEDDEADAAGH